MSTFYTNKMTIQVSDAVRIVFHDERHGVNYNEHPMVSAVVGDAVMTLQNARALRDLLVQHVHDEAPRSGGDVVGGQSGDAK